MYNVPSLSAQATAGSLGTVNVTDSLTYYVEFVTPAGTEHNAINVVVQSSVVLSMPPFASNFEAQVLITGGPSGTVLDLFITNVGTQSQNGQLSFIENQQYSVFETVQLGPVFGAGLTSGSVDPIFTSLPAGVTLETSDGIGNNSPVGATPIPAALPLFATGLGALSLLGWRRKRKA